MVTAEDVRRTADACADLLTDHLVADLIVAVVRRPFPWLVDASDPRQRLH